MEAGLVLAAWAVPESTMAIAKLAKEIATRVRVYRDASKILQSLHEFGYAYHNSLFKKNIDLAVALVARTNDKCFDHALQIQIQQLHQELQRAKDLIFRMVDENGQIPTGIRQLQHHSGSHDSKHARYARHPSSPQNSQIYI